MAMTDTKNGWQNITAYELRLILRRLAPAFEGRDSDNTAGKNIQIKDGYATMSGKGVTARCRTTLRNEFLIPYEPMSRIASLCRTGTSVKLLPRKVGGCEITYKQWRWLLVCATNWVDLNPVREKTRDNALLRMTADEFVRGLKAVTFAKADSSVPPTAFMHNVMIEVLDGTVHMVATDGRRLALFTTEIDQAVDDAEIPLNGKTLERLAVVIGRDEDASVQVCYTEDQVVLELPHCSYRFARPSSGFGNWRKILGDIEEKPKRASVGAGELQDALNSVSVCVSDTSKGIDVVVSSGVVNIRTEDSGKSDAKVKLHHSDSDCETCVNPAYMTQWLSTIEPCEPVFFDLCGTESGNALFATEGKRYLVCRIESHRGS